MRSGLAQLPKPKRDYEVLVPEEPDEVIEELEERVMDGADMDAMRQQRAEQERQRLLAMRSQVVRRGLPVPSSVNAGILRVGAAATPEQAADEMVKREMLAMIQFDRDGTTLPEAFTEEELANAKVDEIPLGQ